MRKIVLAATFIFLLPIFSFAGNYDAQTFKKYNPDIRKYEFAVDYINALVYLKLNYDRVIDSSQLTESNLKTQLKEANMVIGNVLKDNMNLRVARNLVKKNETSSNGLVLKVAALFSQACDELIEFNGQEKELVESYIEFNKTEEPLMFDRAKFIRQWQALSSQRKEALKKVLEASLLLNKILISEKPDQFGELVKLAITKEQRKKLLLKLDGFPGKGYRGKLRSGQSSLEGSVAAIREVLEDKTWSSFDG